MERTKQRRGLLTALFAILLTILLLPVGEVHAAGNVGWSLSATLSDSIKAGSTKTIQVEAGQNFYISDFLIEVQCDVYPTPFSEFKNTATYSSSDKKIATVNAKGYVTAKKTGTAKITVKYKKVNYVCTLKVVNKGKLGSTTTYKKLNTLSKTIAEAYSKNITSGNFLKYAKAVAEYRTLEPTYKKKLNTSRGYILKTSRLAVPLAPKVAVVEKKLSEYGLDYWYGKSHKYITSKISSISARGGSSKFTINLKNKLTEKQFYLYAFAFNGPSDTTAVFVKSPYLTCKDYFSGYMVTGVWTDEFGDEVVDEEYFDGYVIYKVKPGTNKITASVYKNEKCTKAGTLIKGMTYTLRISGKEYDFKAK